MNPDAYRHPAIQAIHGWPADRPLAAVLAGDPMGRTTHSLIAEPAHTLHTDTFAAAMDLLSTTKTRNSPASTPPGPFGPGWITSLAYRCGYEIEPAAQHGKRCIQKAWPAAILARINAGWVIESRTGHRTSFGSPPPFEDHRSATPDGFRVGSVRGLDRMQTYIQAVRQAIKLIHAGDIFQVNLTHRLGADFAGSPRALFAELAHRLQPWHAVYLEYPGPAAHSPLAIASFSPELFLELSSDGTVTTRPMKGTRPGNTDAAELDTAEKDRAELAMIVDLMRNDLGRLCAFGSVIVEEARRIEPHGLDPAGTPELFQGVATITGKLRPGETVGSLLRATFPPGSVTGAPKIRAMQIIDKLEQNLGYGAALPDRGPYCGSCGFVGDNGAAMMNVAIRTAIMTNNRIDYPVGAGIVADSDPVSEWNETIDKAKPFLDLAATCRASRASCGVRATGQL